MTDPLAQFEVHKASSYVPVSREMLDDEAMIRRSIEDMLAGRRKWRRKWRAFRRDLGYAWSHIRDHRCELECDHSQDWEDG